MIFTINDDDECVEYDTDDNYNDDDIDTDVNNSDDSDQTDEGGSPLLLLLLLPPPSRALSYTGGRTFSLKKQDETFLWDHFGSLGITLGDFGSLGVT